MQRMGTLFAHVSDSIANRKSAPRLNYSKRKVHDEYENEATEMAQTRYYFTVKFYDAVL